MEGGSRLVGEREIRNLAWDMLSVGVYQTGSLEWNLAERSGQES